MYLVVLGQAVGAILVLAGTFSIGIGIIFVFPYVFSVYATAYEDAFGDEVTQEIETST